MSIIYYASKYLKKDKIKELKKTIKDDKFELEYARVVEYYKVPIKERFHAVD